MNAMQLADENADASCALFGLLFGRVSCRSMTNADSGLIKFAETLQLSLAICFLGVTLAAGVPKTSNCCKYATSQARACCI